MPETFVEPSQLCIGMFVSLDLSWMQHPFMTNSFKIKNKKQLAELRGLGLKRIKYDPAHSDAEPLPIKPERELKEVIQTPIRDEKMWQEKQIRIKKMKARTIRLNRCEKSYSKTASSIRNMMHNLMSQPKAALEEADTMVSSMVDSLVSDQEATMHLVNMKGKSEAAYFHAVNVTILALMLGKQLGLNEEQLKHLGVGAIFHDLGYNEIPNRVLLKKEELTKAEQDLIKMHPLYGVRLANRIGTVPPEAVTIIEQHHEMQDGSGYPKGLKGKQISELAQIITIVNSYDNLCNKKDAGKSLTPYEAVSMLFAKDKQKYDFNKLTLFITNMGVYPPGTVVKLTNNDIAVVTSINTSDLLSPRVMLYDPCIPSTEALIIDLKEEGLKITESVRLSMVSDEIRSYFNLGDSVNVYFDSEQEGG
ncbi:MAG: HD-GYP domain-containing protein [Gammaproteobacteria bacterium]|nr:HD-GYP domain-containing protein [Gammaproteobacteria bacterium]